MNYASLRQRFENSDRQDSRRFHQWPTQVDELSGTSAEYVLDECEKLFERSNGQLQPLHRQRLLKLLQRLHLRFGPDAQHNHFRRLLRRSLRSMNFAASIIILQQHLVHSDLTPISADTLDLLTQTCVWVRSCYQVQQRQLQRSRETLRHVLDLGAGFTYLADLLSSSHLTEDVKLDAVETPDTSENEWPNGALLPESTSDTSGPSMKPFDDTETQFEQLVHLLLPSCRPSHCYAGYGSLLELLIRSLPSIDLVPLTKHTRAERLLRICLCALLQQPRLDVNPPIGWQRLLGAQSSQEPCNETTLLQLTIDLCHYDVAARLVQLGARIAHLRLQDVLFLNSTERLFQLLYVAGHLFPPANRFRTLYSDCIRQDKPFERFCRWLRAVQSRQLPLTCLCWNALRASFGSDSQDLLDEIEQQIALPPSFVAYARYHALDILTS
jgi:hypothetical protein